MQFSAMQDMQLWVAFIYDLDLSAALHGMICSELWLSVELFGEASSEVLDLACAISSRRVWSLLNDPMNMHDVSFQHELWIELGIYINCFMIAGQLQTSIAL